MRARHTIKVIVNGNAYLVELGDFSGTRIAATVNGKPYQVEVDVVTSDRDATGDKEHAMDRALEDEVRRGTILPGAAAVTAPMPGNIANIEVRAGDLIVKDQVLCFLEAMKMNNAIRSPRDGVIASVGVTEGQAVAYGDVLFVFE